jgi:hypothetical protein
VSRLSLIVFLDLATVEITLPDDDWSKAKRGGWLCMQGLNALIVHSTHIQFLTMLFPSTLEVNLIFGLLGKQLPLSVFDLESSF